MLNGENGQSILNKGAGQGFFGTVLKQQNFFASAPQPSGINNNFNGRRMELKAGSQASVIPIHIQPANLCDQSLRDTSALSKRIIQRHNENPITIPFPPKDPFPFPFPGSPIQPQLPPESPQLSDGSDPQTRCLAIPPWIEHLFHPHLHIPEVPQPFDGKTA